MAAENQTNKRPTCGAHTYNTSLQCDSENHPNMTPTQGITTQNKENMFINIPLLYDSDVPMDSGICDGGFHSISLHGLIEHIALDTKNIEDSLKFIAKYITNKQVEPSKANKLDDFNGIGNAV